MKGYMYILRCADGSYYTGSTKYLEVRLKQHQDGEGANHTKKRLPVELVYFEEFDRIDTAFYREKQIQGWSRRKKEALISLRLRSGSEGECRSVEEVSMELHELARCRNETSHLGFGFAQPPCDDRGQPPCGDRGQPPCGDRGQPPCGET